VFIIAQSTDSLDAILYGYAPWCCVHTRIQWRE